MTLFESSFVADHNGRTPSFISQSHNEIQFVFLWTIYRVFVVLWTARTELSNDVHFSIAVQQNTSSDLPDIHVKQPQRQTLTLAILISNLLCLLIVVDIIFIGSCKAN